MKPAKLLSASLVGAALTLLLSNASGAAPDVSGKWKWNIERNGNEIEITMNLQQDGSKLTGKLRGPEREAEIHNGTISDDGKLSFYINYERDQGPLRIDFQGKAQEDKISGQFAYKNADGEKVEREWIAKKDVKKHDVSGAWKSTFKRQDGTEMESTLTLKQDAGKISGKNEFNGNETELREGKLQGDEITFKIIRERDGRTVTAKYRGQIKSDKVIKGQIESDWTGEVRKLEWEARKE